MRNLRIIILSNLFLFLLSCGTIKEGFSNQKKNNSDEFLVEKKAPLVMPPNYNELPTPKIGNASDQESDNSVKKLITVTDEEKEIDTNKNSKNSLEKIILDKIKK